MPRGSGEAKNQLIDTDYNMAIFKAKVESNYALLPNATLQDKTLSYEATGLLAMMLSLPDDWEIHKTWLQSQKVKCGRDKLTGMMNELIEAGYVMRKVKQKECGLLDGVDWLVYPTVQLENRNTVKPSDGKPANTKETDLQSKQSKKLMAQPKVKPYPDEFEWIWSNKPEREGGNPKKKAYQACNARIKEGCTWRELADGLKRYRQYCDAKRMTGGRHVQQMATFFGTGEGFKEQWAYATNQQGSTNGGDRKLSSAEEYKNRLRQKRGDGMERGNANEPFRAGMDSAHVHGDVQQPMEARGSTIQLEADDWRTVD